MYTYSGNQKRRVKILFFKLTSYYYLRRDIVDFDVESKEEKNVRPQDPYINRYDRVRSINPGTRGIILYLVDGTYKRLITHIFQ